jgi:hypothetical protein
LWYPTCSFRLTTTTTTRLYSRLSLYINVGVCVCVVQYSDLMTEETLVGHVAMATSGPPVVGTVCV